MQNIGWEDSWSSNGETCGTTGKSKRVEAVQVVLVEKGAKAPNKTYKGVKQDYAKAYVEK